MTHRPKSSCEETRPIGAGERVVIAVGEVVRYLALQRSFRFTARLLKCIFAPRRRFFARIPQVRFLGSPRKCLFLGLAGLEDRSGAGKADSSAMKRSERSHVVLTTAAKGEAR